VTWWRWPALVGLYLASRLFALTALPMFLDERIHLRWAYWVAQGRRLRVPVLAGRGLSVYMLAAVAPGADDPLRAGRLLTVAIGLVTLIALYFLALRLGGDRRVADITALFYIVCPFTLAYDRMVLTDAFLAAFTALTLLLSVRLAFAPRARTGAALGAALALGVLSKTTGLVLFGVPVLVVLLLGRERRRAIGPLGLAFAIAGAVVAYPLWLFFRKTDELVGAIGVRENDSSFSGNAAANFPLAAEWLWTYWTPGLVILALLGVALGLASPPRRRMVVLLFTLIVGPAAAFVAFSGIWYPRYLLFTTVPLLPLAAGGFVGLIDLVKRSGRWGRWTPSIVGAAVLVAALRPALLFDHALWTDPTSAPFPALDRFQYVTGWPSGYGSRESLEFLRAERRRLPEGLVLITPGPSTTASAARLLWANDPVVEVRSVDPGEEAPSGQGRRPVYVIVSLAEGVLLPERWAPDVTREFASFKPDGSPADALYRACAPAPCR
jgi:4-amino-4-deoxy-L-arabinose transferase-like glycosyltransferase